VCFPKSISNITDLEPTTSLTLVTQCRIEQNVALPEERTCLRIEDNLDPIVTNCHTMYCSISLLYIKVSYEVVIRRSQCCVMSKGSRRKTSIKIRFGF